MHYKTDPSAQDDKMIANIHCETASSRCLKRSRLFMRYLIF